MTDAPVCILQPSEKLISGDHGLRSLPRRRPCGSILLESRVVVVDDRDAFHRTDVDGVRTILGGKLLAIHKQDLDIATPDHPARANFHPFSIMGTRPCCRNRARTNRSQVETGPFLGNAFGGGNEVNGKPQDSGQHVLAQAALLRKVQPVDPQQIAPV